MEKKKYLFVIVLCLIINVMVGQNNQNIIYKAYIKGNMEIWKNVIESFNPSSNHDIMDLINYQYGYIAFCIDLGKTTEAENYIKMTEKLLGQLEVNKYQLSNVYAYKAALVGFKIGLSPLKAPFIGKKSVAYANKALDEDNKNYFGYIQKGHIAFYTPEMFGGSKTDAINYYIKGLMLIEQNVHSLKDNWNYLNVIVTIILAYEELGQYKMAAQYCLKALTVEPDFDWVKNEIYPKILKQINNG